MSERPPIVEHPIQHRSVSDDFMDYKLRKLASFRAVYVLMDKQHQRQHENFVTRFDLQACDRAPVTPAQLAHSLVQQTVMADPEGEIIIRTDCFDPAGTVHTVVYDSPDKD